MVRMNYELPWPQIVLSCLQNSYQSIQLFVIHGIIQCCPMKLFTKVASLESYINTTLIPTPEASHTISKALSKLRKQRKGALVNLSFNKLKVFSCTPINLNTVFFFFSSQIRFRFSLSQNPLFSRINSEISS